MFCSNCGVHAEGNFCSACGHRLSGCQSDGIADAEVVDWTELLDYEALLRMPEIRDRISRAANQATTRLSGEEFLQFCDKALQPLTGVPLTTVAKIVQPIYGKLGIKTGKLRSYVFAQSPGKILVELLCTLASHGHKLLDVVSTSDGCVLKASIPADIRSLQGELLVTIKRQSTGVLVEAATLIQGAWFDWGKSSRCLEQLFGRLSQVA